MDMTNNIFFKKSIYKNSSSSLIVVELFINSSTILEISFDDNLFAIRS